MVVQLEPQLHCVGFVCAGEGTGSDSAELHPLSKRSFLVLEYWARTGVLGNPMQLG